MEDSIDRPMFGTTQTQAGEVNDDLFTLFATEIAVKKCRLIQKKEKVKLLVHSLKETYEEIRQAKEESKRIGEEEKEIAHRQLIAVENLKRTQESRQSLETMLCELNTKVAFERTETKRQSDEYKAAMQKSRETWESYEKKYNEWPLAKEVQALKLEMKKIDFECQETLMLIADVKGQQKLKDEITDKLCHTKLVKLAKLYFEYQSKMSERGALLRKKRELERLIEKTKSEKDVLPSTDVSTNIPQATESEVVKQTQIPQRSLMFSMPEIQVMSPPPEVNSVPYSKGSLFDWSALLGSSYGFLNFRRSNEHQEKSKPLTSAQVISNVDISQVSAKPQSKCSIKQDAITVSPVTSTKTAVEVGMKRKTAVEPNNKVTPANQLTYPLKKPKNQNFLSSIKPGLEVSTQQKSVIENTNVIGNITKKEVEKENTRPNTSLTNLKKYVTNFGMKAKSSSNFSQKEDTVSHNLLNMLSLKNSDKNIEVQNNPVESSPTTTKPSSEDPNRESEKTDETIPKESERNESFEGDLFANEEYNNKQPDNPTQSMNLNSPPDIVPVENNSQPLSQGFSSSAKFISQISPDFNSPLGLTEKELLYQKIAVESPEFTYPEGTDMMISHKTNGEVSKPLVHSQYFSDVQPYSPPNTSAIQDDYQSMSYSPNTSGYANSPPNAVLGSYGLANSGTNEMPLFGSSKNDESNKNNSEFSFSFGGGSSKKSSNIFSLF